MNAAAVPGPGRPQDPTVGLYSATNQKQGFLIQTKLADGLIDIITGRRPMTTTPSWSRLALSWRRHDSFGVPASLRADRQLKETGQTNP